MKYMSVKIAAEKWGISERSVRDYCTKGRVPGAMLERNQVFREEFIIKFK